MIKTAVILAGGLGTRLAEETTTKPKPMVEIGGLPIIMHLISNLAYQGIEHFIVCCGYKGYLLKEYFSNYHIHTSDVTFDIGSGTSTIHHKPKNDWKVTLVDTGDTTMTGGRLLRIKSYVSPNLPFLFTYGDGLANIDIKQLANFHKKQGVSATVTAVRPPGRFGALEMVGPLVRKFNEKPEGDGSWINGGFFILEHNCFDLIEGDNCIWENEPLTQLAGSGELAAYLHHGFWQPMDTMRDKMILEKIWLRGDAPWTVSTP